MLKEVLTMVEQEWGATVIAVTSDCGGESRAARARLIRERPDLVAPDCYAHQVSIYLLLLVQLNVPTYITDRLDRARLLQGQLRYLYLDEACRRSDPVASQSHLSSCSSARDPTGYGLLQRDRKDCDPRRSDSVDLILSCLPPSA